MLEDEFDPAEWEALDAADKADARQKEADETRERLRKIDARERPTFEFVAVGDLELKEPDFLVQGLIERGTLGMFFGDPGHGKTFGAVDVALSIATGEDFHGHSVKQGSVFYIAGEGHSGLARRFAAWAKHRGVGLADVPLFKSATAAQFLDAESAAAVTDAVDVLVGCHGPPALIVVDTLARNYGPGDENATKDMGLFVAAMDELRGRWPDCVILIVHHSGHSDKQRGRGSMALKGALDFEYRVSKDGDRIQLSNTKMKDAEPPAILHFTLDTIELGDGVSSAVLVPTEGGDSGDAPAKLSGNAKLARETYITAAAAHGIFDPEEGLQGLELEDWRAAFYARHTGDNTEAKKKAFQNARKALTDKGLMDVENSVYCTMEGEVRMAIVMQREGRDKRDGTGQD